jgi:hypothetical protein
MRLVELRMKTMLLGLGFIFTVPPGLQAGSSGTDHQILVASALKAWAQKVVQAGDLPITIGGFRFRIARVAFDTTAMGFVPEDMGPKDLLMFVEFELLSGNRDDFKGLGITLDGGLGTRSKAAVLASGGMMKALSALTIKSLSSLYLPENANIAWAFVVKEGERDFFLTFPTGDVISLAPLIKEDCAKIMQTSAQNSSVQPNRDKTIKIDKRKKNKQDTVQ